MSNVECSVVTFLAGKRACNSDDLLSARSSLSFDTLPNVSNDDSPPLFAQCGISLPKHERKSLSFSDYYESLAQKTPGRRMMFVPVTAQSRLSCSLSLQQTLNFMIPSRSNVVRLPLAANETSLSYGICDVFRGDGPAVEKAALALKKRGIFLVGQLIQLSEDELLAFPFMNPAICASMHTTLTMFDLDFNSALPRWNKKYANCLTPAR